MTAPTPLASGERTIPRWGLGDAVIGWLVAFFASAVTLTVALVVTDHQQGDPISITLTALSYPPLWIGFVGVPIWAAARKGNGWVEDFRARMKPIDALVGLAAGIGTQLILVPLVSWPIMQLADKTSDDLSEPARKLADTAQGTWQFVLFALIVAVGAPLAEELFFRGLVLRSIEKRWTTTIAIVGSSVVFGATHMQPLQFAGLTVAGLVFALLAVRYDRLGPAVFAHMGFNATTVVALWGLRGR